MGPPYRLPSQCPLRSPFSRQPRARHRVPYTRAGRQRNPQARCVDCHGRKGRKINGWAQRLPLSESQRRDGPSKDTSKWKGARGWPCGVRERVFRIGPIRHCISNRAIYFDMSTCRMTGLFGTASERQILMAGVRGRLEKGRQAAKVASCFCSARPATRDKESPPRARHGERLSKGQGSASFIPSWRDATRSREPPSLSSRCKKQASRQAGRQARRDKAAPP